MTFSIYAAPWDQPKSAINFTTPIATTSTSPVIVHGIRSNQTTGSRYLAVRRTVKGIEEQNFNILHFTLDGHSDWIGNYPAAPYHLRTGDIEGGRVELTWEYQVGSVIPDGFHVYSGNGSVSYSTPIRTVPYSKGIQTAVLPAISADTLYGVRAFFGPNIEQNTQTVLVTVPPTLVAVTVGAIQTTWRGE